jgi:hypothetical protein
MVVQVFHHRKKSEVFIHSAESYRIPGLSDLHIFEDLLELFTKMDDFRLFTKGHHIFPGPIVLIFDNRDDSSNSGCGLHEFYFIDFFIEIDLNLVPKNEFIDGLI